MIELGLKATRMKAAKYRSYKGKVGKVAPNVLNRCFNAIEPNRKWSTDITEVKIKGKKLYISTILDMFNGEIVTYTMSDHPDLRLVTSMVRQAFKKIVEFDNLIFHSDQGWHYQHQTYQKMLNERGVVQSMSRKGNCLDNSMMENFFGLMKTELLYLQDWDSIEQFKQELKNYIYYYNHERIKIRLDGMSPVKYRIKWMDQ
jgi:transposase InsO family protein